MDIKGLYRRIDGDYEELVTRLGGETIVPMLLNLFLEDPGYDTLVHSMETEDYETAFRAAHGMKGLCANLSITGLRGISSDLTEALRGGADIELAKEILPRFKTEYERVKSEIQSTVNS